MLTPPSEASSSALPKATLYWNPTSVWSTVPRLALIEMGYRAEDVELKEVNISEGANFSPEYLRVNPHGTIPTLVVPIFDTVSDRVETRYRTYKDTLAILDFLDSARPPSSPLDSSPTHHLSRGLKLSPATMQGKTLSDSLILAVHLSTADPNFLLVAARTPHELLQKESGFPGRWLKMRQIALLRFLEDEEEGSQGRRFLTKKLEANSYIHNVYFGPSNASVNETRRLFFAASLRAWSVGIVEVLEKLEEGMDGPLALGDRVSLADLHIIAWLARLIFLSHGGPNPDGITALEDQINSHGAPGGFKMGGRVREFWGKWAKRDSFQQVYVSGLR